ncbi:MAG: hypothetical protein K2N07_02420, partial [Desulfovibrio sp.]|nr:hypothetical protein [Desulfovibrio sp.]
MKHPRKKPKISRVATRQNISPERGPLRGQDHALRGLSTLWRQQLDILYLFSPLPYKKSRISKCEKSGIYPAPQHIKAHGPQKSPQKREQRGFLQFMP